MPSRNHFTGKLELIFDMGGAEKSPQRSLTLIRASLVSFHSPAWSTRICWHFEHHASGWGFVVSIRGSEKALVRSMQQMIANVSLPPVAVSVTVNDLVLVGSR